MTKYIVTLFDSSGGKEAKKLGELIADNYEGYYPCGDDGLIYLIDTGDSLKVVAQKLWLSGPETHELNLSGMVVKLNGAYTGKAETALVDWLEGDG